MKNKIIKKRRKNPKLDELPLTESEVNSFYINLRAAIETGLIAPLVDIISLMKIGRFCTDCEKRFDECECEFCPDCKLNRCLCNWNLNKNSKGDEVRLIAWKLAKEMLNNYELDDFYHDLIYQRNVPEKMRGTRMETYILEKNKIAQHLQKILK